MPCQAVAIGIVCMTGFIALAVGIWLYVGDKDAALALLLYLSLCFVAGMCIYIDSQKEAAPVHKPSDPVTWGELNEVLRAAGISAQGDGE